MKLLDLNVFFQIRLRRVFTATLALFTCLGTLEFMFFTNAACSGTVCFAVTSDNFQNSWWCWKKVRFYWDEFSVRQMQAQSVRLGFSRPSQFCTCKYTLKLWYFEADAVGGSTLGCTNKELVATCLQNRS